VNQQWVKARKAAGLPKELVLYCARHDFGTYLTDTTGTLKLVMDTYIPDWYAIACFAVDLALGGYVAARVPAYQRASRIETEN